MDAAQLLNTSDGPGFAEAAWVDRGRQPRWQNECGDSSIGAVAEEAIR